MTRSHSISLFAKAISVLLAIGLSFSANATAVVGSDGGNLSVDNSGQAAWSLPIDVPSGVNGLAPNLNLSVSTAGGNGYLGVGGGLSGLSSISRCGKSLQYDGFFRTPQFEKTDAYCLDGARLLLESGEYGEAGSTYRTAVESFQRIKAIGSVNGTGPASFEVTNRAGAKTYYGASADRNTFESDPVTGAIAVWKVDYLKDSNDNRLHYSYENLSANEVQLKSIHYGYNPSQGADADLRIELTYGARPDTSRSLSRGTEYAQTKRITNIKTFVDDELVRDYRITYEQGLVTNASRIVKVQECASDNKCYRPSQLVYAPETQTNWRASSASLPVSLQDAQGNPTGTLADINNDGKIDVIVAVRTNSGTSLATYLGDLSGWKPSAKFELPDALYDYQLHEDGFAKGSLIDINGDGWADYVQSFESTNGVVVNTWRNTGDGFELDNSLKLPLALSRLESNGDVRVLAELSDLNADGLLDIVQASRTELANTRQTLIATFANGTVTWSVDAAYTAPTLAYDYLQGEEGRVEAVMQDVNADGLVDWVRSVKADGVITNQTWLNNGQGFDAAASSQYALPASVALFDYDVNQGIAPYSFADINADGLPDLVKAIWVNDTEQFDTWLHTGLGWQQNSNFNLPAVMQASYQNGNSATLGGLIDLNSDGHPDFMRSFSQAGESYEQIWLFDENTQTWVVDSSGDYILPFINYQVNDDGTSSSNMEMADLDHDGYPELFSIETGATFTSAPPVGANFPGTLIKTIDSFKAETALYYGITTDESIYTPAGYSAYPDVAYNAPTRVVTKVTATTGRIESNGEQSKVSAHHTYGEARTNMAGLGGYGYAYHGMRDGSSDVELITYFHQTFPYAGKVKSSTKKLGDTLLSISTSRMATKSISINGLETLYAYPDLSVANTYTLEGALLKTTRSATQVDNYGNTTESVEELFSTDTTGLATTLGVSVDNAMAGVTVGTRLERKSTTEVTFKAPDLDRWLFGLPEYNIATLEGRNSAGVMETYVNRSSATFYADGKAKTETLEPGNAQQVVKSYAYDGFGNRIESSIETNEHEKRTTTTSFSADGRFPASVTNNVGHTITSEFDKKAGKPSKVIDPNGITKEILYDGFGTVLRESKAHQSNNAKRGRQIVLPKWCDENDNTSINCPQNAEYFIAALDDEGEAPEISYFDRNGKELRKQTYGFDGKIIVIDKTYDAEGRLLTASQPYFRDEPSSAYVTLYKYDDLGRQVERVNGANDTFRTKYDYLTVEVTNPGNNNSGQQVSKVVNNIFGQPVESHDAHGSVTRYEYDGRGKLVNTIDAKGNIATITYDPVFGRKIQMDDPDLGVWTYQYDSLGNLVLQTDAKQQQTKMVYDHLNRLVERIDDLGGSNEETTRWTYSDAGGEGLLKGGLEKVESANLTRTVQYDIYGRVTQATSLIDGKSFTQRTGYNGTADKMDWVQYPSGLTVRSTYDDYGFPATVEGIGELNTSTYDQFQSTSRSLIDAQREFEAWKDQNLSLQQLAELEEHEREVRRLGKYLSDFYSGISDNPDLKAQQQAHQDIAQRYIDLVNKVQTKIDQHQNWLAIYQAKAETIQDKIKDDLDREDELRRQHNPDFNELTAKRADFDALKVDHDNYQSKAHRYAGYINAQVAIIDREQIQVDNNTIHVNNLIESLFTATWAPHYKRHWDAIFVDLECCSESVVLNRMKTTNQDLISSHLTQIGNYLTLYSAAVEKIEAANQKIVDGNWQWWYDYWEGRRANKYAEMQPVITRLTQLDNLLTPVVNELEVIANRTRPDRERLNDWLLPLINSHNNVILSFNDRARGYIERISAQTGSYVNREDLKWENFLKPIHQHADYLQCLKSGVKQPGRCRAEHLVHVYDENGNVDTAKQTEARAAIGDRDFMDVRGFWESRRFLCSSNLGYSCPAVFEGEIKQLAKSIHAAQCAAMDSYESEGLIAGINAANDPEELADNPHLADLVTCDSSKWGASTGSASASLRPYLVPSVSLITNINAFKESAKAKHKANVVALVSAATDGSYNHETNYEKIVNDDYWVANASSIENDKPQSREKQCIAWAPSSTAGNQPVCTAYGDKVDQDAEPNNISYVLIRKGEVQTLLENAQSEDVRYANENLRYHQQQIQVLLDSVQTNYYASSYLAIQNLSADVSRLYNEIDQQYADAEYIDDYELNKKVYWQAQDINSMGQIKKALYGNGVETEYAYDQFGRITSVHTTKQGDSGHEQILNKTYQYDALGNLTSRFDIIEDVHESFTYDGVNRLTQVNYSGSGSAFATAVGQDVVNYSYDELGNIITKSDIATGSYVYGQGVSGSSHAGPHAVTRINGMADGVFTYDKNGNQLTGRGRTITYTPFNKPSSIVKNGLDTKMWYGPERQMVKQVEDKANGGRETTIFVGGAFEQVSDLVGTVTNRHHITVAGNVIAIVDTADVAEGWRNPLKESYLHKNHQSSVLAITDAAGQVIEKRYFDAFGELKSYIGESAGYLTSVMTKAPVTPIGFTGHRFLQTAGVIHMRGRVYDAAIGRFLSADPHIQSPLNSQSLNRYAYVWNNPLSFTDPSGYFLSSIFKGLKKLFNALKKIIKSVLKAIKKVVKAIGKALKKIGQAIKKYYKVVIAVVAIVVVAYFAPQLIPKLINAAVGAVKAGAIFGGVQGLIQTGSLTGALKGAINGAINGAKGFVAGFTDWRSAVANFIVPGAGGNWVTQAFNQGLRSGIVNKIRGLSFSAGFKEGALGSLMFNAGLWAGNQIIRGAKWVGSKIESFINRPSAPPTPTFQIELGVEAQSLEAQIDEPLVREIESQVPEVPNGDPLKDRSIRSVTVPSTEVVDTSPIEYYPPERTGIDFAEADLTGAYVDTSDYTRAAVYVAGAPIVALGSKASASALSLRWGAKGVLRAMVVAYRISQVSPTSGATQHMSNYPKPPQPPAHVITIPGK